MSEALTQIPLDRFALVRTKSPEEMEASLVEAYEIHRFDVRQKEDFKGQANLVSLGDVSIGFCAYGAPTFVEFPEVNSAKWQLAVRGSGRVPSRSW